MEKNCCKLKIVWKSNKIYQQTDLYIYIYTYVYVCVRTYRSTHVDIKLVDKYVINIWKCQYQNDQNQNDVAEKLNIVKHTNKIYQKTVPKKP